MYNLKYYSAFASNEIFGAKTVKKLYDYFGGDIESAWNAEISAFYSVEGITIAGMQKLLKTRDSINPDVELEKLESSGFSLLTYSDDKYPELLKQIPDAPMWLYYKGNIDLFIAMDETFLSYPFNYNLHIDYYDAINNEKHQNRGLEDL